MTNIQHAEGCLTNAADTLNTCGDVPNENVHAAYLLTKAAALSLELELKSRDYAQEYKS